MWSEVLERFERHAPVSVMARVALEQALPAGWIDEVFEATLVAALKADAHRPALLKYSKCQAKSQAV